MRGAAAPVPAPPPIAPLTIAPLPTPWARLWNAASLLLIALASAMSLVPFDPALPAVGLDNSWGFAMGAAVQQGLAFGRDLVFTFGPYAGLYTMIFHPATDAMVLGGTALLALAVTAGLGALTRGRGRLGALLLALFFSQMWLRDAIFFCIPALFLALACRTATLPESHAAPLPRLGTGLALGLLVLALALLPLVKGTFGVASVLVLGLAGLLWLLRGQWRMALGAGLLFVLAMPAFWLAAGQRLADLPRFFLAQGEIIRGYTPAMALEGPLWQVAVFGGAAALVLALNLPGLLRQGLLQQGPSQGPWARGLPGGVLLLGGTALLFLAFKAGFVRQDGHVIIAGGTLALLAGALLLAQPRRLLPWAGLAAGLAGWAVLDHAHGPSGPAEMLRRATTLARAMAQGGAARLHGGTLQAAYEARLALLRQQMPLPAIPPGTVDIYSIGQSALLAHGLAQGLTWSPRPVLQSYSAYTAPLAALNAAHLAGPRAPATVLLALEPIDNRLPALEDGASWPVLLARYAIAGRQGALAVLRRRAAGGEAVPDPLREVVASGRHALGARVALPGSPHALWATLRLSPSPLGRAMNTLFRLPEVQITLQLSGGGSVTRRFIPGAGEAGFLMAPLVQDARQFIALAMPGTPVYADQRPVAFTLSVAPQGAGLWQPDYALELRRFEPPAQEGAAAALLLAPAATAAAPAGGRCYLDVVDGVVPGAGQPLTLGRQVRLNGWGYPLAPGAGPARGVEPAALSITLTAPDGRVLSAPAELMPRPDVGAHFGQPELVRVGFQALLDLGALGGGPYRLALGLHRPEGRQDCPLFGTPVRVAGE